MKSFAALSPRSTLLLLPIACIVAAFKQQHAHPSSTHHNRALASRQHRENHATTDTCSFIPSSTISQGLSDRGYAARGDMNLDVCACASSTRGFLAQDSRGRYIGHALGSEPANDFLSTMIHTHDPWNCKYPLHSTPHCTRNDPCHFDCNHPWALSFGKCVCSFGMKPCNGDCVPMSQTCGSAVPHAPNYRRGSSLEDAKKVCGSKTVCGIPGQPGSNTLSYDCVETGSDEASCGGCLVPHPFSDAKSQPALGVDCHAIPGVNKAACISGRCDIRKCENGWKLKDGACVPEWWKRAVADFSALSGVMGLLANGLKGRSNN